MAKYDKDNKTLIYESVSEFYNIQAERGAKLEKFKPTGKMHIIYDLKRFFGFVSRDDRILDAGCRDGWAIGFMLSKRFKRVQGFDVIDKNVEVCHSHGYKVDLATAEFLDCYADSSFDAVFCRHTLEHIRQPRKAIKEFARILKKKGIFYCTIPLEKKGTHPHVKYGHSYVFNTIDEVVDMSFQFKPLKIIKRENTRSGIAGTFVGCKV